MFSFSRRKQELEVQRFLKRLVDTTSPNRPPTEGDERLLNRYNRTLPVLLVPLCDDLPAYDKAAFAVTKNVSDQGLAVVLPRSFQASPVIIGFWCDDQPAFVRGEARHGAALGGGFWQFGVELETLIDPNDEEGFEVLLQLARGLQPAEQESLTA